MEPGPQPIPLDYTAPALVPKPPRPAARVLRVVAPFAGGSVAASLVAAAWQGALVSSRGWGPVVLAAFVGWGLASVLLIGGRAWEEIVRLTRGHDLACRAWWLAALAGAADVAVFAGVTHWTRDVPHGKRGPTEAEWFGIAVGLELAVHVGWAAALTRRRRPADDALGLA